MDGPYKEFKTVSSYDPDKSHKYAVGTSGNQGVLGRRMRGEALKLEIVLARRKYSVTDGAEWIARQRTVQLPILPRETETGLIPGRRQCRRIGMDRNCAGRKRIRENR